MALKILRVTTLAMLALAVSVAAHAQRRYSDLEIVDAITRCLLENAPDDWQAVIFRLEPGPAGKPESGAVEHKVIAGAENNPPRNLEPCRPDYVAKAVNSFRENQDEKARGWTGITITVHKDGRFSVAYHYPK